MKFLIIFLLSLQSLYALENGEPTFEEPYAAQVRFARKCTATHLGKGVFLTAAHCMLTDKGTYSSSVRPGKKVRLHKFLDKRKSKRYRVKSLYVHETYIEQLKHLKSKGKAAMKAQDFAMFVLQETPDIPSVSLLFELPEIGQNVMLAGAGCDENEHSGVLKIGPSHILFNGDRTALGKRFIISDGHNVMLCPGDSGGGLYINDQVTAVNSAYLTVTIDGEKERANMFHPVSEAREWIENIMSENGL